jgi:two-component system, cell cycle response regulator
VSGPLLTMNRHILIVEDDLAVRNSMAEFITITGFDCQVASSAEEAIDILKTTEFQVVITDIMMPGMDGLELTDIIKKDYDIDVIVMTGYSGQYSYEEAIGKGASDFVFKPIRFQELLLRLKRVFKERELRLERNRMMADLQHLAITDSLTQLYNSRHFFAQLKMEIERANRYGHSLALLLLDIDFFKNYNDTYGHLEGDKVLCTVGQMIKTCLRTMDTAYRYGGEEFTVILPYTDGDEARTVADRIQYALEFIMFCPYPLSPYPERSIQVTLSIGVTVYSPGEELTAFVSRSDRAMYASKESGRNRVSFLPPDPAS